MKVTKLNVEVHVLILYAYESTSPLTLKFSREKENIRKMLLAEQTFSELKR